MGSGVWGLGFGVWGFGFRVWGLGFRGGKEYGSLLTVVRTTIIRIIMGIQSVRISGSKPIEMVVGKVILVVMVLCYVGFGGKG